FCNYLSFYSCEDLQIQMKRYLRRSNRIPMSVLGWKTPIQKRQELETAALMNKLFPFFGLTSLTYEHFQTYFMTSFATSHASGNAGEFLFVSADRNVQERAGFCRCGDGQVSPLRWQPTFLP
ncbi:MAG: hypothetical protein LUE95_00475, partial [Oscillospiraceae bacterium]|nr:hypothetical protein [Oscillospiraceae bacterium]